MILTCAQVAPRAARHAHQAVPARLVILAIIKLLKVLDFASSATRTIGQSARNLQWSQLVEALTEANALGIPQVLPVMAPSAPVLRHKINTLHQTAGVNLVEPTAKRPPTTRLLVPAQAASIAFHDHIAAQHVATPVGCIARCLQWMQLAEGTLENSAVALQQVLPVMAPSAPVLRQWINTFLHQMARVNLVAPTARRPPTTRLRARAQETRP